MEDRSHPGSRAKAFRQTGMMLGLLSISISCALAQSIDEYQAKAAFLFNFAKFVEWPAGAVGTENDPIRICVLGPSPFGSSLENLLRGKDIAGRPLLAVKAADLREASSCQILFVAASECKRFKPMAAELSAANVLTVGESESFLSLGGIVNFKVEDGRIRFDIRLAAADQAKLRISSKLLSLARIVK